MLRLANRTARAATAGLLGLLVAAPPPARAEDDEGKRSRPAAARHQPGDRDGNDDRADRRRNDRNERRRDDSGRSYRRDEVRRPPAPDHAGRDRHESPGRSDRRGPPPPPPKVVRHDDHRDRHEHRDRDEHRDRSEWHGDRHEWRKDQERREEWREHQEWRDARYVSLHGSRWHWHGDRWCPPGHRHPPGRRVGWYKPHDDWRWARYRRPVVVHSQYYCAPCSHWYGDRYAFDRHVYGYHGVPQLSFGDAVAQMVWGLVYFGL